MAKRGSEEYRSNMSKAMFGKRKSKSHCKAISKGMRRHWRHRKTHLRRLRYLK